MTLLASRRLLILHIFFLWSFVVLVGCGEDSTGPSDLTAPSRVVDLSVVVEDDTLIVLTWTAPTDEGSSGRVEGYDIRYSTSPITEESWSGAEPVGGEPTPTDPGQEERFVFPGLRPAMSYYFALKATDRTGNESDLSNVVFLDVDPPSAVTDLAVTGTTSRSASLTWTAPADNSEIGRAAAYEIGYSLDPISEETWAGAVQASGAPAPGAAGTKEVFTLVGLEASRLYYCAIRSVDGAGNVSAISSVAEAVTSAAPLGWWDGFGAGGPNAPVSCMMPYGSDLIVGGEFTAAGSASAHRVASWDGDTWTALGQGFTGGGTITVRALSEYDGELIAGGYFRYSGTTDVNDIARWDGQSWLPLGLGVDNLVMALKEYGGDLYAGGVFFDAGGHEANSIAYWDGAGWGSMGWSLKFSTGVSALAVYGGELIAGGLFSAAGTIPADNVARWDGTGWRPLGYGLTGGVPYSIVTGLAVYNGDLIAAGDFTASGDTDVKGIARWDGSSWSPLGDGIGDDPATDVVGPMTVYNGTLVVAGHFSTAGGVPVSNIARWDGAGWSPLGEGLGGDDPITVVRALAVFNGSLYAGGSFTTAGGLPSSYIARWDD